MMPMTTSNSINEKAGRKRVRRVEILPGTPMRRSDGDDLSVHVN